MQEWSVIGEASGHSYRALKVTWGGRQGGGPHWPHCWSSPARGSPELQVQSVSQLASYHSWHGFLWSPVEPAPRRHPSYSRTAAAWLRSGLCPGKSQTRMDGCPQDTSLPSPRTCIQLPELPHSLVSQRASPEGEESRVQGDLDNLGTSTIHPLY